MNAIMKTRMRALPQRAFLLAALLALAAAAWVGLARQTATPVDAHLRAQLVANLGRQLAAHYVFPDKAAKMGALLRERLDSGAYDRLQDADQLASAITADLQSVTRDLHMHISASRAVVPTSLGVPGAAPAEAPSLLDRARGAVSAHFSRSGVDQVNLLAGGVGYLKLSSFAMPTQQAPKLARAFDKLAASSSLIIDLRDNPGGDPQGVALLAGYLLAQPTHLNDIWWRDTRQTSASWSMAKVDGRHYGANRRVFILTSRQTRAAAEEFAYSMKQLQRATIVGESTWGGAHPTRRYFAGSHFVAHIPTGRAINPISRSNWELTGVIPDLAVPPAKALDYVLQELENKHLVLN
jgi:hypothetical protein